MRLLFEIDTKDYDPAGKAYVRPSARCINIKDGKVAMVHSRMYDYYKFPGGGIEPGETKEEAVIRETLEEAGLVVIPESVKEYGLVHRIQSYSKRGCDLFIQDNYYYLCDVQEEPGEQSLDLYEQEEGFTFEYADPDKVIETNRKKDHGPKDQNMLEREARVLELLKEEGYF